MIKNILNILSNPILYYASKSGCSVFRNYCVLKNTGCKYNTLIPKQNVGRTLEFRFEIDKHLKRIYLFTPIILYLIFIHYEVNIGNILFFLFLWSFIIGFARIIASYIFSTHLIKTFGKYELTRFKPPVSKEKKKGYKKIFIGRAIVIICLIGLFFMPAIFIQKSIKTNVEKKEKYSRAIKLSKLYFALYPQNTEIYDLTAKAKYMQNDYKGALEDYKKVLTLSGKKFSQEDLVRLGNIMYLQKLTTNANEAVDVFNELSTKKNTSIDDMSQLLWIKSIFKIENNIADGITQEYDDLLLAIEKDDAKKRFYITSDKAYISYLMGEYIQAINLYTELIDIAEADKQKYSKELMTLYAERGFARRQISDYDGADEDFTNSQISRWEISKYEPKYSKQVFVGVN